MGYSFSKAQFVLSCKLVKMCEGFALFASNAFAAATPCKLLGCFVLRSALEMTRVRRHCEIAKCVFCPSLRAVFSKTAWQSINLNANLPLDCHEFARSRFANSRNDKFLAYTGLWRSICEFKAF